VRHQRAKVASPIGRSRWMWMYRVAELVRLGRVPEVAVRLDPFADREAEDLLDEV
jgi:hypothetical protein